MLHLNGTSERVSVSRFCGVLRFLANDNAVHGGTNAMWVADRLQCFDFCAVLVVVNVLRELKELFLGNFRGRFHRFCYPFTAVDGNIIRYGTRAFLLTVNASVVRFFLQVVPVAIGHGSGYLARVSRVARVLVRVNRALLRDFRVKFLCLVL